MTLSKPHPLCRISRGHDSHVIRHDGGVSLCPGNREKKQRYKKGSVRAASAGLPTLGKKKR